MSDATSPTTPAVTSPAEKVRTFPTGPGVYLMKDAQGRVVYIGKAKNLRARAGSYFQKTADDDKRIKDWIGEVVDVALRSGPRGSRAAQGDEPQRPDGDQPGRPRPAR